MSGIPRPVVATLRTLTSVLEQVIGPSLTGVYLYGSLTQRAFDSSCSDVDCLVVVRRHLTDAQFRRLRARLAHAASMDPWTRRVQMQILRKRRLLRHDTRGALYQFGKLRRSGSDGNPIVWLNVLKTGITLVGPQPRTILPPITGDMVFAALEREVEYLRAEIADPASEWRAQRFYRDYAVLTLCRILYTHRRRGVVSKPQAARWALRALPPRWHSLVRAALGRRRGRPEPLPLPRIARFIEYAADELARPVAQRGVRHPKKPRRVTSRGDARLQRRRRA